MISAATFRFVSASSLWAPKKLNILSMDRFQKRRFQWVLGRPISRNGPLMMLMMLAEWASIITFDGLVLCLNALSQASCPKRRHAYARRKLICSARAHCAIQSGLGLHKAKPARSLPSGVAHPRDQPLNPFSDARLANPCLYRVLPVPPTTLFLGIKSLDDLLMRC